MNMSRSSLARYAARSPVLPGEMEALRRRAWRGQGCHIVCPEEVIGEWTRQVLINKTVKRYGARIYAVEPGGNPSIGPISKPKDKTGQ